MSDTMTDTAPAGTGKTPVIKPTLHHFGQMTTDIDALCDWYQKVVGFEVMARADTPLPGAYVTNDDVHHRGSFIKAPGLYEGELPKPRVGIGHIAFEYDTVDDLLASWKRLKEEEGIEALVLTCHDTHWAFYYKDPDGCGVELLADCYGDRQKSLARIKEPDWIEDPMGPRVDPELMIEARKQGASLEDMHRRSMAAEFEPAEYNPVSVLW
jgi:catechol 2,3-dioxygenase-like lactoylglutathione lyase family enzyme